MKCTLHVIQVRGRPLGLYPDPEKNEGQEAYNARVAPMAQEMWYRVIQSTNSTNPRVNQYINEESVQALLADGYTVHITEPTD